MTIQKIADHYLEILKLIGEDPTREGLQDTPLRAAKALLDATSGLAQSPDDTVNNAIFKTHSTGMITVSHIPFFSTCEHHLMPFEGVVHIGYLPSGQVLGLSKIPRIVDLYARRLQIQELLTEQIATAIHSISEGRGTIVSITAKHSCMRARGIKSDGEMTTTVTLGEFDGHFQLQDHFWNSVRAATRH